MEMGGAALRMKSGVTTIRRAPTRPCSKQGPAGECGHAQRVMSKPWAPRGSSHCSEQRDGCQVWSDAHSGRSTGLSVCTPGGAGEPQATLMERLQCRGAGP